MSPGAVLRAAGEEGLMTDTEKTTSKDKRHRAQLEYLAESATHWMDRYNDKAHALGHVGVTIPTVDQLIDQAIADTTPLDEDDGE